MLLLLRRRKGLVAVLLLLLRVVPDRSGGCGGLGDAGAVAGGGAVGTLSPSALSPSTGSRDRLRLRFFV